MCVCVLRSFCQSYDMKPHSTKVFRDIVNALGSFIQSLFITPNAGNPATTSTAAGQTPPVLPLVWGRAGELNQIPVGSDSEANDSILNAKQIVMYISMHFQQSVFPHT